jgi:hypothetical protein
LKGKAEGFERQGRIPEPFEGFIGLKCGLFDEFENEPPDPMRLN